MNLLIIALISFLGSLVQGVSGFGFALVFMSLLPFFMDFTSAVIIEAVLAFFMVSYMTIKLYKHVDLKIVIPPAISAGIFSYIGINTLLELNDSILKRLFGVLLLALAAYFVFVSEKIKIKGGWLSGLSAGMVSGFTGGLFSVGGPPMVVYFMAATDDKMKYIASIQAFFAINSLTVIIMHLVKGSFSMDMLPFIGVALLGVFAGTVSGMFLFKKMNPKTIRYIISILMVISGINLILRG